AREMTPPSPLEQNLDNMVPLRIGVTGSGFMGRTHVDAAHKLESVQPIAVAGGSRAARLAEDYGTVTFRQACNGRNFSEAMDEEPGLVKRQP
ncbi:MAG: hypothetical protein ABGX07_12660, partial [Pirellulaceae bacterium]